MARPKWIIARVWGEDTHGKREQRDVRLRLSAIESYAASGSGTQTDIVMRGGGEQHVVLDGDLTRQLDALLKPVKLSEVL